MRAGPVTCPDTQTVEVRVAFSLIPRSEHFFDDFVGLSEEIRSGASVNRTFVTPLDREDIHALAISLDDVMDAIDAAAAVTRLYKIDRIRPGARRLADIVCESMDRITEALGALEKRRGGVLEIA